MAEDTEQITALLVELQSQLAFQDEAVQALNDALAAQQREILQLRRQLVLLRERQDEQAARSDALRGVAAHEKPPHY
ncbi:MAG: SlyX family protein [Halioglobus sp.]|nr:SlyX family protein [Halioglobus sp.]